MGGFFKNNFKVTKLAILLTVIFPVFVLIGCSNSTSSTESCEEPENPYQEGTAQYEGYKWAEMNGRSCSGSSISFNEGCEEYYTQENEYESCVERNK